MRTPSARKPGSTWPRADRLRSSRPAPVSSTTAAAVCPMVSACRSRWRTGPAELRPESERSTTAGCTRVATIAGATPNRHAVTTVASRDTRATRRSNATSSRRGRSGGARCTSTGTSQAARASAASAPRVATTAVSARSCCTRRPRLAPRLTRTAISRARRTARATRSAARFAQVTTRMRTTAPRSISRAGRARPMSESCMGSTRAVRPALSCGYADARRPATVASSAPASSSDAPGRRRARTR